MGKAAFVNNTILGMDHGTMVAGLVAGHTDSINVGYPAIGFNCRFDFEGIKYNWGGTIPSFSSFVPRKRRIVNLSGGKYTNDTLFDSKHYELTRQLQLQEVYEEGGFFVAGAGNGYIDGNISKVYCYPASYDYAFSVSGVDWNNN